jgi:hypothetical protein
LPKDKDGNAYIAKNTSFQSLFQTLFTKISWPSPSFSEGSISASTSIVGGSADASGVVEVGTIVNIGSVTVNKSTSSITNRKWSGFTYGYATSVTGQINSSTYITGTNENNVTYSGNYTLSGQVSGFSGISYTQISNADNTQVTYDAKSGTIKEGTNSITFSLTGAKASVTLSSMPVYYIASNVKTLSADHKTEAKNNKSVSSSNPTASKSVSVTGKYLYYLGYSSNTAFDQFNSDSIKKLTTRSGWTEIDGTTTIVNDNAIKSNGNSIVIACANKYKLSSIKNALGADIMESFSSVGTVDYVVNDTTTSYNVYVYPITNGAEVEFKNVSLVKA